MKHCYLSLSDLLEVKDPILPSLHSFLHIPIYLASNRTTTFIIKMNFKHNFLWQHNPLQSPVLHPEAGFIELLIYWTLFLWFSSLLTSQPLYTWAIKYYRNVRRLYLLGAPQIHTTGTKPSLGSEIFYSSLVDVSIATCQRAVMGRVWDGGLELDRTHSLPLWPQSRCLTFPIFTFTSVKWNA